MTGQPVRFRVHSIAVEIRGPGAADLASRYDYFAHRPGAAEETEPYSVTVEIGGGRMESRRQGNFSYGRLPDQDRAGEFLQEEIRHFLEKSGLHFFDAVSFGAENGQALMILGLDPRARKEVAAGLSGNGLALLSASRALVNELGRAFPYPVSISPEFRPQEGIVPSVAPGSLPRPAESFSPGHLVLWKVGAGPHKLKEVPPWKLSLPLLKSIDGRPTPSRIAAALSVLSRSRRWEFQATGASSPDSGALVAALGARLTRKQKL